MKFKDYYTVARYNQEFKCRWDVKQRQTLRRNLKKYCAASGIEVCSSFENITEWDDAYSYPLSVIESVLEMYKIDDIAT